MTDSPAFYEERIRLLEANIKQLREALEGIDSNAKRLRIDQGRGLDSYIREALAGDAE